MDFSSVIALKLIEDVIEIFESRSATFCCSDVWCCGCRLFLLRFKRKLLLEKGADGETPTPLCDSCSLIFNKVSMVFAKNKIICA